MTAARLTVCVGGGGVGKTTCSAALALHLARSGQRTLVVTVDPARRLADALGVEIGHATRPVSFDAAAAGRLSAKMPDPRVGMGELLLALFDDPAQRERVQKNPAFRELSDSLAGVHELLTVGLVQEEIDSGRFDEVVLDTAPSRNALAFLDYPTRLLGLLEARALGWLAALTESAPKGGLLSWGKAKVEGAMGRIVGLSALRDLSALFGEMLTVRERWAASVRRSQELLADPRNRYFVIGAPTGGSVADVRFLAAELERRSLALSALVLNRAAAAFDEAVAERLAMPVEPALSADETQLLLTTVASLRDENAARVEASETAEATIRSFAPRTAPIFRLPLVRPGPPQAMVLALAEAWRDVLE